MTISIEPGRSSQTAKQAPNLRDCGPAGCDVDWLSSERVASDVDDVMAFTRFSLEQGWGDGLPLIPPTEARVRQFLSKNNRFAGWLCPSHRVENPSQ